MGRWYDLASRYVVAIEQIADCHVANLPLNQKSIAVAERTVEALERRNAEPLPLPFDISEVTEAISALREQLGPLLASIRGKLESRSTESESEAK